MVNIADVGTMITVEFLSGPVVPAGSDLVVEIANLDDGTEPPEFFFRAMSNDLGQCGSSYLRAIDCAFGGWVALEDIGFPDAHLIQSVSASEGGVVTVECFEIPEVCGKGAGPCNIPNGTPGCEDQLCCAAVCDILPECCIDLPGFEWTQVCADKAIKIGCALFPCPVSSCEGGVCTLTQSQDPFFDQFGQVACGAGGNTTENAWARCYNLVEEGVPPGENLTINSVTFGIAQATMDGINVDVILYIDCDGCPPGQPGLDAIVLATQSLVVNMADVGTVITVDFPKGTVVPAGTDLIVEIGNPDDGTDEPLFAFRVASNAEGQCGPSYLRAGDCGLAGWVSMTSIGFPNAHLVQSISASVGGEVTVGCDPVPEACGKGAGACGAPNGTPGCDDTLCCASVCAQDPNCCDVEWDQACADLAALDLTCPPAPCVLDTAAANHVEAEACGDDTNGGCNSDPAAFEPVSSGDIIHGTAWADGATRDTDWYLLDDLASFDTNGNGLVDIHNNIVGELPVVSFILVDALGDCSDISLVGTSTSQTCVQTNFNVTTVNTTDIIYIFAGTGDSDGGGIFDGFPCTVGAGAFGNNYLLCLTVVDDGDAVDPICPPAGKPCPSDLDGNGDVDVKDLLILIGAWGPNKGHPADLDGNGDVDVKDLLILIGDWGPC